MCATTFGKSIGKKDAFVAYPADTGTAMVAATALGYGKVSNARLEVSLGRLHTIFLDALPKKTMLINLIQKSKHLNGKFNLVLSTAPRSGVRQNPRAASGLLPCPRPGRPTRPHSCAIATIAETLNSVRVEAVVQQPGLLRHDLSC